MRLLSCLLMTFAAHAAAQTGQPVVEVFLPPVFGSEMVQAFHDARGVVEEIYSEIGVRVVWRNGRPPAGCAKQPMHVQIVVATQPSARAGHTAEAWAFANPYLTTGACVTLLTDPLNPAVKRNPLRTGFLLGHVLAHEMGHVLEGVARHSETGVMKGQWSLHETSNMWGHEQLRFTAYDAELILDTLRSPADAISKR